MDNKKLVIKARTTLRWVHNLIDETGRGPVSIWSGVPDQLSQSILPMREHRSPIFEMDWSMKSRVVGGRVGETINFNQIHSLDYSPTSITVCYAPMASLIAVWHGRRSEPELVTLEIAPLSPLAHGPLVAAFKDAAQPSLTTAPPASQAECSVSALLEAFREAYEEYSEIALDEPGWRDVPFSVDFHVMYVDLACEDAGLDIPEFDLWDALEECVTHGAMNDAIETLLNDPEGD